MEPISQGKDLRTMLDEYERRLILLALAASGGHQRRAAASLGVLPSTLSEKMKRLGLRSSGAGEGAETPRAGAPEPSQRAAPAC